MLNTNANERSFLFYTYDNDDAFLEVPMSTKQYLSLIENDYPAEGDLVDGLFGSTMTYRLTFSRYNKMYTAAINWARKKKN